MPYDIDQPRERYNTDITREYFRRYRPESEKHTIFRHFSPYADPDSDILAKTCSGLVYGSFMGTLNALFGTIQYSKHFSLIGIAAKSYRYASPWIIAGASYGVTVGILTQVRKKESPAHHAIAGYAAGTMFGSWYKSPRMGVWFGAITAVAAGLGKYFHDNDMLEVKNPRRPRVFNFYRLGWFIEKPPAEGRDDAEIDVSFKAYRP